MDAKTEGILDGPGVDDDGVDNECCQRPSCQRSCQRSLAMTELPRWAVSVGRYQTHVMANGESYGAGPIRHLVLRIGEVLKKNAMTERFLTCYPGN